MQLVDPFGWVGSLIDSKFAIDTVAGEGGFGVVYRGTHLGFELPIAVKCLRIPPGVDREQRIGLLSKFRDEARLLHRLSRRTAHIVQALDIGAATAPGGQWTPYIVMEWLEGETLASDLARRRAAGQGPRSLDEAIELLAPAARALAIAHEENVVHRDVKPANLFLARAGSSTALKILDFGIAKVLSDATLNHGAHTQLGTVLQAFTPQYGAPEQFSGRFGATGPWTDVFAMALVLVELVSGRPALAGSDVIQLFTAAVEENRRPSLSARGVSASAAVEAAISRALAASARLRFRDMGEMWSALEAAHAAPSTVVKPARGVHDDLAATVPVNMLATGEPATAPTAATAEAAFRWAYGSTATIEATAPTAASTEAAASTKAGGWQASLAAFLANACTVRELLLWVKYNVPAIEKDPSVMAAGSGLQRLANAIASRLERSGLVSESLFNSLADLCEPSQRHQVESIRAMWNASLGQQASGASAVKPGTPSRTDMPDARGSIGVPSAEQAGGVQEASHTSIVLDRIGQWRTILEHCGTRGEHLAFIVHCTPEQGLSLFIKRIQSYLHHECRWVHHVMKVQRTGDHTTARTADEWQRSLIRATRTGSGEIDFVLEREARKTPVLFLFADANEPLRNLEKDSVRGLIQLFRSRIAPALKDLDARRAMANPVRFVLPIEHPPCGAGGDPVVRDLSEALGAAGAFHLEPVKELGFPSWLEVREHIEAELETPGDALLVECAKIHHATASSPERSLQRLGDALQRVLMDWEEQHWYNQRR